MPIQSVRVRPRRSLILIAYLTIVHVVAGLCLIPLTLVPLVKWGLMLAIAASLVHLGAVHGCLSAARSVVTLVVNKEGGVTFAYLDGELCRGTLRGDTYVHPMGVLLRIATATGACQNVVLLRGQIDVELFRRLRVLLRSALRELNVDEL